MRQFRITTSNLTQESADDCILSPDDPIHALKPVSAMGGIGTDSALAQYNNLSKPKITGSDKGQVAREQNIQPGTEAWFKHWFGGKHES